MFIRRSLLAAALAAALCFSTAAAEPFTFQGFVESAGIPISGSANLRFRVYNAEAAGSQIGDEVEANAYPVADGVFSIDLDFGPSLAFDGSGRFLEVEVNGQVLTPRFAILPAPLASSSNALRGRSVSGSAPSNGDSLIWNGVQWTPQAVAGGTYVAGIGLNLDGSTFSVAPTYRMPQGCSSGEVAKWNGTAWACAADAGTNYAAGAGLNLTGTTFSVDFAGSGGANTVARSDHNHYGQVWTGSGSGHGLRIEHSHSTSGSSALLGRNSAASGLTVGVWGDVDNGTTGSRGVFGAANSPTGDVWGVHGRSDSSSGRGVFGLAANNSGLSTGVWGQTLSATNGARGVYGFAASTSGDVWGVHGRTDSTGGRGVFGDAVTSSGSTFGVLGRAASTAGTGVRGETTATTGNTVGVHGVSASVQGIGVHGVATADSGNTVGVRGDGRYGVVANGTEIGMDAVATNTVGQAVAVQASTGAPDGAGLFAMNSAASGNAYGAFAQTNSTTGTALAGDALASSGSNIGVLGRTASGGGTGMRAENIANNGSGNALQVVGNAPSGDSLVVDANGSSSAWAIIARSAGSTGRALNALLTNNAATGTAVYAQVNGAGARAGQFVNLGGGTAASFTGNVDVSGTLSKGGGSFKIDHPLDPENKFLFHSFVESPDMMNIYNGNVVTGKDGYATIDLPEWFDTLNRDFRYQLTVIGSFAQAIIAEEIEGNRFVIQTSAPSVKVSWQVTGVRQDPWAEANRIEVEVEKSATERGKYLHPEAWGQPRDKGLGFDADGKQEE